MNDAQPHRRLCTDCGVSRTAQPARCAQACQFIAPDYPALERRVHGRARSEGAAQADELFFGPYEQMHAARLRQPLAGAQWTGLTTRLAERLLETGQVDAVGTTSTAGAYYVRLRPNDYKPKGSPFGLIGTGIGIASGEATAKENEGAFNLERLRYGVKEFRSLGEDYDKWNLVAEILEEEADVIETGDY